MATVPNVFVGPLTDLTVFEISKPQSKTKIFNGTRPSALSKIPKSFSGRARRLSAPWDSAHADSPVDGRTQELDLRLDRLESIMVQLHEKLVAIESKRYL